METEIAPLPCESQARCGVDVGINRLATLSQGKRYWDKPKASRLAKRRLARLQRKLAKKERGSRGRYKQKLKIAKLHKRIADIRSNSIHHLTIYLIKNFSSIVIEDLNVQGMMKNHHLAGAVAKLAFMRYVGSWNTNASGITESL